MRGAFAACLISCTWISPAEHAANKAGAPFAAPASVHTSGSSDKPAGDDDDGNGDDDDNDIASTPPCEDDPFEPNDTSLSAWPVALPTSFGGLVCAEARTDWFAFDLTDKCWLEVQLSSDRCGELWLRVEHSGSSTSMRDGDCPRYAEPSLADTYTVGVWAQGLNEDVISYDLSMTCRPCDEDLDGYEHPLCGGSDCDDLSSVIYPGATELSGNGLDEDCDGGDELPAGCPLVTGGALLAGALPCGDLYADPVWDRWEVSVAGSALSIVVQNDALTAADPLAFLVAPDGLSHAGLDGWLLDEELACSTPAWSSGACPGSCLDLGGAPGTAVVWVAQREGLGCIDGALYTLDIAEDGVPLSPVLVGDDVLLSWP